MFKDQILIQIKHSMNVRSICQTCPFCITLFTPTLVLNIQRVHHLPPKHTMSKKECYLRHTSSDIKLFNEMNCSVFHCSCKFSALLETQCFNYGTQRLLIFSYYHSPACVKLIQLWIVLY